MSCSVMAKKNKKAPKKAPLITKDKLASVTVLSGFLGSGKTTLLKNILQNTQGERVAVVVNDMGEVNIDAEMVKAMGHELGTGADDSIVELTNGCICCTLRDDMVKELVRIVADKSIKHIVIESTGISEPMPVAAGFMQGTSEDGTLLKDLVTLDTMVTVVDLSTFKTFLGGKITAGQQWPTKEKESEEKDEEEDKEKAETPEEAKQVAELLCDQVEFANTIILNKTDLVDKEEVDSVKGFVAKLNAKAKILTAEHSKVPVREVLGTKTFDFDHASSYEGWTDEVENKVPHIPETIEYGISSFLYERRLPFHPAKIHAFLESGRLFSEFSVLRAKGFMWIPSGTEFQLQLSIAGRCWDAYKTGVWLRSYPIGEVLDHALESMSASERKAFDEKHKDTWENMDIGDRRQEIVVIGRKMDHKKVTAALDECLLTEEEFAKGEEFLFGELPDPFKLMEIAEMMMMDDEEEEEDEEFEEIEEEEEDEDDGNAGEEKKKEPRVEVVRPPQPAAKKRRKN